MSLSLTAEVMVGQGGRRTARANRLFSPSSLRHYEISLGAGLAKGTVYNSFPSKQALFLAVIEHGCSLAARAAKTVAPDMPIRERLRAASEGDLARARAHEPFARVFLRELLSANPRLYPAVLQAAAPLLGTVTGILADGQVKRRGGASTRTGGGR